MSPAISGAAVVAGVAGQPIRHSLSPLIHNAWIAAAGLDAVYAPFGPRDAAGFEALVEAGRGGALRGLNVTAPFKALALALADDASDAARVCGSANLLLFEAGRVTADSTDGAGLIGALDEQAPAADWRDGVAVVLGAGGAAAAAAAALTAAGVGRVRLINRTLARAEALAARLEGPVEAAALANLRLDADIRLVVNAVSAPLALDLASLAPGAVVMDMTYRPVTTPLLAAAAARGLTPVDGLAMLIAQARPSFEALFGVPPPALDVRALALAELERTA